MSDFARIFLTSTLLIGSATLVPMMAMASPLGQPNLSTSQAGAIEKPLLLAQAGPGPEIHHRKAGERRAPWHRPMHHDFKMMQAKRLTALEVLVGIRTNQLDAWREYTAALLDMFDRPMPPKTATGADGQPPVIAGDRIANAAIEKADKARKLQDATAALKKALTPEQLDRLARADHQNGRPHAGSGRGAPRDRGDDRSLAPEGDSQVPGQDEPAQ